MYNCQYLLAAKTSAGDGFSWKGRRERGCKRSPVYTEPLRARPVSRHDGIIANLMNRPPTHGQPSGDNESDNDKRSVCPFNHPLTISPCSTKPRQGWKSLRSQDDLQRRWKESNGDWQRSIHARDTTRHVFVSYL